jgi:hypothetical protein
MAARGAGAESLRSERWSLTLRHWKWFEILASTFSHAEGCCVDTGPHAQSLSRHYQMLTNAPQVAETCRRAVGEASDLGSIGKHLVMSRREHALIRASTVRAADTKVVATTATARMRFWTTVCPWRADLALGRADPRTSRLPGRTFNRARAFAGRRNFPVNVGDFAPSASWKRYLNICRT